MKVVQINSVCGKGSTGGITIHISRFLADINIENYIMYTLNRYNYPYGIKYSNKIYAKFNALKARIFGNYGFNSHLSTKRLIKALDKINPDVVHIHNIHSHDLNFEKLFKYLKAKNVRVIYTLHDCWLFTGYCMHFDEAGCRKWHTLCNDCPQSKRYSFFNDRAEELFLKKKQLLTDLKDLTIVAPSKWLADLANKSFLNKYPIKIINNGINLDIFKKTDSDFKKKYKLENKKNIVGIPKGSIEPYIKINRMLSDDYKLVLVGLTKKQIKLLDPDIIGLP